MIDRFPPMEFTTVPRAFCKRAKPPRPRGGAPKPLPGLKRERPHKREAAGQSKLF